MASTLECAAVEDALPRFRDDGVVLLGPIVDAARCSRLLNDILSTRAFGPDLFLTEQEFRAHPERRGVNPRPGRPNVVDRFDLSFILDTPVIQELLDRLCGNPHARHVQSVATSSGASQRTHNLTSGSGPRNETSTADRESGTRASYRG